MKSVEFDELVEHADAYLVACERLTITRDGLPIGMYLPFREQGIPRSTADKTRAAEAAARLAATLDRIYAETGMTEDEFVVAFLDDSLPQNR